MTKCNAIIMNIVSILSKWHNFRLNSYLLLIISPFTIFRLFIFYIEIILQLFFSGVIFIDNIPDDDTMFQ